ncbi:MAG: LamG-like jellyroll fold domain-containing protein, partial [Myxococcota bacterium]|nr:LamG-like jellyroll fold domain-containing protein [Myxococcota bacterium]
FWLRWSGDTGEIMRRGDGATGDYRITVVEGGYLQFEGEATYGLVTALSDTAVAADEWHHVAMLYANPQFVRWYVDGIAEPTVVLSYPMPEYLSVEPLQLSCGATAAAGRIDSVRASPIVRYPQSFSPNSVLTPDQDTSFLFAFDQPALFWPDGQVRVLDMSPYGRDGMAESGSFVEGYP